jgi:hypothetical protein
MGGPFHRVSADTPFRFAAPGTKARLPVAEGGAEHLANRRVKNAEGARFENTPGSETIGLDLCSWVQSQSLTTDLEAD